MDFEVVKFKYKYLMQHINNIHQLKQIRDAIEWITSGKQSSIIFG
jgi:hypothetical protein